ncbi:Bud-site selection protein [Coniophora puteana RWD-64-598 SS2]|uniref:Bud-site selection protein n=1 Tax=Coniophora puteana (strain RWD-64-598) TaxID=741705 RepID=A0A5M3MPI9_CONPW|nr:Bud-site selection protein [Coniophora puteana RWD-64-598 SS2]EIW80976.1 Bud-site selection protein [Coniophora puteana RWD-64-598 SS2]
MSQRDHNVSTSTRKQGKKRKHSENQEEVNISGKLHHGVKEVRKAAKKAKAFELQKVLKRLKGVRTKGESSVSKDTSELEAELEALKNTDIDIIANTALRSKIKKDKMLSSHDLMEPAMSKELSNGLVSLPAPGSPASRVQSRILSSKILATEISGIVLGLKAVLYPDTAPAGHSADGPTSPPMKKSRIASSAMDVDDDADDHEGDDGSAEGDDNEAADHASDGWESGSIHDGNKAPSGGASLGSEDEHDISDDSNASELRPSVSKSKIAPKTTGSQSAFLPSLAAGFIRGDSDEDWSDAEANVADGVRKNRRGQRARRAIWEKKFGKNANHLKSQQEIEGTSKNRFTRTPTDYKHGGRRPQDRKETQMTRRPDQRFNKSQTTDKHTVGRELVESAPSKPAQAASLHPSWEAKKQKSAAIVAPQGSKIVF